jgi:hypothetical protein
MDALRPHWDAERPGLHSHAERGSDRGSEPAREWSDSVLDQTENDLPVWLFREITLVLPIR